MPDFRYVGRSVPKVDGRLKATGSARYTSDLSFPTMLWADLLRSPHPHARILNIDTSRAQKLPGVKAVITGQDTPMSFGVSKQDQTPLARHKVRHVGDAVAAVAAVDMDTVREALSRIKVDYQELPAVFEPRRALAPGAPQIHQDAPDNVAGRCRYQNGSVEQAFAEADYVCQHTFHTQRMAHLCPEPHNCLAVWEDQDRLTLYLSSQMPSLASNMLAQAFGLPSSKVRVVTNHVGGGFGSKTLSRFPMDYVAPILAKRTGRPVKMGHSRAEEFIYSSFQPAYEINVKTGVKRDGTITGRHFQVISDCGGYASYVPAVTSVDGALQGVLYRYQNYLYEGTAVYTNLPYGGALRSVGSTQIHFAGEAQLNMIAAELGLDPVELRIHNATRTGDKTAVGAVVHSCGLAECLEKVAHEIGWKEKKADPRPNRGLGVGCGVHFTGIRYPGSPDADFAGAAIRFNDDGSVNLATSCVDIGPGTSTVLSQIAAEVLGVDLECIHVVYGDTENCPMGFGTRASRNTAIGGKAVMNAALEAKEHLLKAAAQKMNTDPRELEAGWGRVYLRSRPEEGHDIAEIVRFHRYRSNGQAIMTSCHWDAPSHGNTSFAFSFGAKAVELEVDPGTGRVKVLEVVAANDLGKAINPLGAVGQIEGGVYMGLGAALGEAILLDEQGRMQNANFLDYRAPTALDVPPIKSILVESNDPVGPFGAKGVGEMAMIGTPDAVAGAVFDACGQWITDLPITAEKLLSALRDR
ncbi:MAG: hypothetical protein C4525_00280 [Desulfarculus sp.]|jgi:putative selenate reductase molybdopterin-binding subunit|nr:MAG: hypothetical protein C4525_00280 [Desulfarculus sp.]